MKRSRESSDEKYITNNEAEEIQFLKACYEGHLKLAKHFLVWMGERRAKN